MRVARGFFRLWLVLSVLWIGWEGTSTWWEVGGDWSTLLSSLNLKTPGGTELSSDGSAATKTNEEQRVAIQNGIKLALIPPVLVLAVGSSFWWAFKGFRSSR